VEVAEVVAGLEDGGGLVLFLDVHVEGIEEELHGFAAHGLHELETLVAGVEEISLEAIERLSLSPFDLMLLDLNMPDIGGIEVLEFVRGQDTLRALPVLIVTTRGDDESRERVLSAGASGFLAKPFTPDSIIAEVRSILAVHAEPSA
jgi:two-component system chemotaxis response regulator CheY